MTKRNLLSIPASAILCLFLFVQSVYSFVTGPELFEWIQNYRYSYDTDRISESLEFLPNVASLSPPYDKGVLAGFYGQVLNDNPEKATAWFKQISGKSDQTKSIIGFACLLFRIEIPEPYAEDFGKAAPLFLTDTKGILERTIRSPVDVGILWGAYFASGKIVYVQRISDCMSVNLNGRGPGKLMRLVTTGWSVHSMFLYAHSDRNIAEVFADKYFGYLGGSVVSHATPFVKDAVFSAWIHSSNDQEFNRKWYQAGTVDNIAPTAMDTASIGDRRSLALIFGAPAMEDFAFKVTCKLQIYGPDGSSLDGIRKKYKKEGILYDPKRAVQVAPALPLYFDHPCDTGRYTIIASFSDRLGENHVEDTLLLYLKSAEAMAEREKRVDGYEISAFKKSKKRMFRSITLSKDTAELHMRFRNSGRRKKSFKTVRKTLVEDTLYYTDNRIKRTVKYYSDGAKKRVKYWYRNGHPKHQQEYNEYGRRQGEFLEWHKNGVLIDSTNYAIGLPLFIHRWYPSGVFREYVEFMRGQVLYGVQFAEDGKQIAVGVPNRDDR